MREQRRRTNRRVPWTLCCLLAAGCLSPSQLNRLPIAEPEGERLPGHVGAFGPLVDLEWKESTVQWGIKPLFSARHYRDVPLGQAAQFEVPFFAPPALLKTLERSIPPRTAPGEGHSGVQVLALYPFFMHESSEPVGRTWLLPLYYNLRNDTEEVGRWHIWGVFPIYFGGDSDKHGPYHAVFPLGGVLKNVLGRDRIAFVLFPLYSHATSGERDSYYVLFPFFRYAKGGGRDAWHVWPLVGRAKTGDDPPRWFLLWPFFWWTETPEPGENDTRGAALFPLWAYQKKGKTAVYNALWPLFSYARNEVGDRTDYVVPWPLLRIGRGEDYRRFQLWPVFGTLRDGHVRRWYALWPVFRGEHRKTEHSSMDGLSLFVVYRSIRENWEDTEGQERQSYENLLWPLWYYKRDQFGNTYFTTLEPRGVPRPQTWDRLYSALWRLFEHETRTGAPDSPESPWRSTRALWGAFRWDRAENESSLRVFPLFSSKRADGEQTAFHVLMGLFGFEDRPGRRTYRVLFLPWSVDKEDASDAGP